MTKIKKLNTFGSAVLLCIVLPLLPLLVSAFFKADSYNDAIITAAMYPISLFVLSRSNFIFSLGIILSILFSIILSHPEHYDKVRIYAYITIFSSAAIHLLERINLHLVRGEKLFNF